MFAHLHFNRYILKNFLKWAGIVTGILTFIIMLFSMVELIRKSQAHTHVHFSQMIKLSLLQVPHILDQLMPLIILFSTLLFLWNLHKKSEIIVMRSLGYSIWNILSPLTIALIVYSVLYLAFLNKAISLTHQAHEQYADKVFKRPSSAVTLSKSGLWLRQEMNDSTYGIIHTKSLSYGKNLGPSTLYQFDESGHLLKRYDVASINITDGSWLFSKPLLTESNDIQTTVPDFSITTKMTVKKIKRTFQSAGSISFLELPSFIKLIEKSGLSGTIHRIQFFKLLLMPFLFLSMALLGGVCAFSSIRGNTGALFILSGIASGFFSHFLHQIFYAMGESQNIPSFFSAFTPTCISVLIGLTLLMHLEEG